MSQTALSGMDRSGFQDNSQIELNESKVRQRMRNSKHAALETADLGQDEEDFSSDVKTYDKQVKLIENR